MTMSKKTRTFFTRPNLSRPSVNLTNSNLTLEVLKNVRKKGELPKFVSRWDSKHPTGLSQINYWTRIISNTICDTVTVYMNARENYAFICATEMNPLADESTFSDNLDTCREQYISQTGDLGYYIGCCTRLTDNGTQSVENWLRNWPSLDAFLNYFLQKSTVGAVDTGAQISPVLIRSVYKMEDKLIAYHAVKEFISSGNCFTD